MRRPAPSPRRHLVMRPASSAATPVMAMRGEGDPAGADASPLAITIGSAGLGAAAAPGRPASLRRATSVSGSFGGGAEARRRRKRV